MAIREGLEPRVCEDRRRHLIGLMGWTEEAWPSASLCSAGFRTLGLGWRYISLTVDEGRLGQALLGLPALGFAGAELGRPYQKEALRYLAETSPAARTMGAVKYVRVNGDGELYGDHLGWRGFLATLRAQVSTLTGLRPLIIGAGDAAASILYALTRHSLPVILVDAHIERAIELVHRVRHVMDEHSFSIYRWPQDLPRVAAAANLIVNTTSLGAWPDVGRSPWPDDLPFPSNALVFDVVCSPAETRFLRQARAAGARTVDGPSLVVSEAALAFEMWTGHALPRSVMGRASHEIVAPACVDARADVRRDEGMRVAGGVKVIKARGA